MTNQKASVIAIKKEVLQQTGLLFLLLQVKFFYSAAVSGTGEITRIASRDKREIFRETRPLGSTPLEAARSSREDTSFKAAFTVSTSLLAMAELNFLTAVLTAELTERFLRRLFSDCRALLRADG